MVGLSDLGMGLPASRLAATAAVVGETQVVEPILWSVPGLVLSRPQLWRGLFAAVCAHVSAAIVMLTGLAASHTGGLSDVVEVSQIMAIL